MTGGSGGHFRCLMAGWPVTAAASHQARFFQTTRALGGHLSYCRFSNSSTNFFSIRSISFLRGTL